MKHAELGLGVPRGAQSRDLSAQICDIRSKKEIWGRTSAIRHGSQKTSADSARAKTATPGQEPAGHVASAGTVQVQSAAGTRPLPRSVAMW